MKHTANISLPIRPLAFLAALARNVRGLRGWRANFVALVAGLGATAGYAPFHIWPVYALALIVLVWLLDGASKAARPKRAGAMRAFFFAFGLFFAGLYWIGSAFISRGPEYIPLIPFAITLLPAGLALIWALCVGIGMRFWAPGNGRIIVFTLMIFAAEWIRGHLFGGLPWNLPALVWTPGGSLSQTAALAGVWGLSLITLLLFSAPAALADDGAPMRQRLMPGLFMLVVLAGMAGYGVNRLSHQSQGTQPGIRLRIVQTAMDQREKWKPENRSWVVDHYMRVSTARPLDGITHLIWPEGALPLLLLEDGPVLDRLGKAFTGGPLLITGVTRRERSATGAILYRNSLVTLDFKGGVPQLDSVYDKHHLVPFGEFMPLGRWLSHLGISSLSTLGDGFTPGPVPQTQSLAGTPPFSPQICYEVVFSGFTAQAPVRPQWIINISNDSWFGATTGPWQHLDQARFRAIEEGIPVVRAVSSGIAGVIDPYGNMPVSLGRAADRAVDADLPKPLPATVFTGFGTIILILMLIGLLTVWFVSRLRGAQT